MRGSACGRHIPPSPPAGGKTRFPTENTAFREKPEQDPQGMTSDDPCGIDCSEVIRMVLLQDGLLAFFSAVGLTTVVWFVAGALLHAGRPTIPGLLLVLPLRGDALAMEADVRELRRVQGQLPGAKIVLADCGLTEDARSMAQYLADRERNADLVDAKEFYVG